MTPLQVMNALGIKLEDEDKNNEAPTSSISYPPDISLWTRLLEKKLGIIGDLQDLKQEVDEAIKHSKNKGE